MIKPVNAASVKRDLSAAESGMILGKILGLVLKDRNPERGTEDETGGVLDHRWQ